MGPLQRHGRDNRDGKVRLGQNLSCSVRPANSWLDSFKPFGLIGLADNMSSMRGAWAAVHRMFATRVRVHSVKLASMRSGATEGPAVRRE